MMLGMTILFSWCQRNLQLSQSSNQMYATNSFAFQNRRMNYVSAQQRDFPLDNNFLFGQLHPSKV